MPTYENGLPRPNQDVSLTVEEKKQVLEMARRVKSQALDKGVIAYHRRERCLLIKWSLDGQMKCK